MILAFLFVVLGIYLIVAAYYIRQGKFGIEDGESVSIKSASYDDSFFMMPGIRTPHGSIKRCSDDIITEGRDNQQH